jgi:PKD repeat protein
VTTRGGDANSLRPARGDAIQAATTTAVSLLLLATLFLLAPDVRMHVSTSPRTSAATAVDEVGQMSEQFGRHTSSALIAGDIAASPLARTPALSTNLSWYQFPSSTALPNWTFGASMTYDPQINGILLFGGDLNVPPYNFLGTMEYIDGAWQDISGTLSVSPPPRYGASLVYDVNDSYALLFGGYSRLCSTTLGNFTGGLCNDTWAFTPSHGWTELFPSSAPLARMIFAMADDPADGYVVLFGGGCWYCGGVQYFDTWIFRAGEWTNWTSRTTVAPDTDTFSSATYDVAARKIVMFGSSVTCTPCGETWTFSSGNWTNSTSSVQPGGEVWASVAYDPVAGGVLEFGGYHYSAQGAEIISNETWLFGNGTWTNLTSKTAGAPPPDHQVSIAYDSAVGAVVILGSEGHLTAPNGTNAVWSWPGAPMVTDVTVSPPGGDAPFNATFSANSSGGGPPYLDNWDFGDGSPNVNGSSVVHEYLLPMVYNASETTTDTGGRVGITYLSISANGALVVSATSTSTIGEAPWTVHFYSNASGGDPPITWSWAFGDGSTSSASWPVHTYTEAGDYSTELTVRDSTGASSNWTLPIRVVPTLEAAPSANPLAAHAPSEVVFTPGTTGGLAPFLFDWSFGDGSPNSTVESPSHLFVIVGTHWVRLMVVDALGDKASASLNVTIYGPLMIAPSATPNGGPAPLSVAFEDQTTGGIAPLNVSWSFGDGSGPVSGLTANHTYSEPGTYAATETVVDAAGMMAQRQTFITVVAPLSVSLTASTLLARAPAAIQFDLHPHNGEGPFAYSYAFGDGGTSSGAAGANHTYATPGSFEVVGTIVDAFHETGVVRINVTVAALFVARITATPQTATVGQTLVLSSSLAGGIGPFTYTWNGLPPGCNSAGKDRFSCDPISAGNFTITLIVGDSSQQNSTASTWVLVLSPVQTGPSGGGTPSGELLPYLATAGVLIAVMASVVLMLRRRRERSEGEAPPTYT